MKNKTALRLSVYFGIALIIFATIIGSTFYYMFRNQTVKTYKTELLRRAESISSNVVEYLEGGNVRPGSGAGGYIRFLSDLAGANAWVIDEDKNLLVAGAGKGANKNSTLVYQDLPKNAEQIIDEVFLDKAVFSEDFSGLLEETTLTVGVPVKNEQHKVIGVVLLHSPVVGVDMAVKEGLQLLGISLFVGLLLSLLLSFYLSRNFTTPILQKEAEDAIRMDKIRRDFVANISHELKTPVTVLRGSLEALTQKVVTEADMVEDYHQQMLKEAIYLQRLIGDLLDLSRLQNADFVMEFHEVSITEVMGEAIRSATHIANQKEVKINFEKDKDVLISGDYGRIRQMIMIVLDNAIKFSPEQGQIVVTLRNKMLSITDYGTGIKEEELPHIFERFYKTRTQENKSGTGLGLAIAKQIADRHFIKLEISSKQGEGTTVNFIFDSKTTCNYSVPRESRSGFE